MNARWCRLLMLFIVVAGTAQPAEPAWRYRLLEGSRIIDDCPICGRPAIAAPLRGSFDLRLIETTPLFTRYSVENLSFASPGGDYTVTGRGEYRIGGEVAVVQDLFIEAMVVAGGKTNAAFFTNTTSAVMRRWPMLHATADQTNGTLLQLFQIEIAAAPIRDIWFSTASGFNAGKPFNSTNPVSGGDLVSWSGNLIKRNEELMMAAGTSEPDLGLDAVDVLPGGDILYSTAQDGMHPQSSLRFSKSGGAIAISDLLMPIIGGPTTFDPGLDAVQVDPAAASPQFFFSLRTNLFVFQDPKPNINLRRGDILVSDLLMAGRTFKSYSELFMALRPMSWQGEDFGCDAFYIWPSGEIWFSTQFGFQSETAGSIQPGDLLSDQGYVVFRNLELLSEFAPLEDLADFGLDALYIITDATPAPSQPRLTARIEKSSGDLLVQWQVTGRVVQLERAVEVTGPWSLVLPFTTESSFNDVGALLQRPKAFYRLRQW